MRKVPLILCLLLAFAAPRAARAQDEGAPPTLVLSYYQCDWSRIGDVLEELELSVPIWEELVAEGMMLDAGSFVHTWADEWNLGTYIVAESIEAALAANGEANGRFDERHPDATAFGEACPRHRDSFYTSGPVTTAEPAETADNPTLVISMYQCDFARIGDIFEQFGESSIPVFDEMIGEGKLEGAGSFAHSWADEWTVGFWTVADDIPSFLDAWSEAGERIAEGRGDAPNLVAEACPVHKDAFYTLGPRTGMSDDGAEDAEDEGGN